jgi:THO complex subunit 1 transcription elongation factor
MSSGAFDKFKTAVNSVLPVISEANKKERLMMGSKTLMGNVGAKRKREPLAESANDYRHDYFFAKFLTSPDLLELEVCFSQMLILI